MDIIIGDTHWVIQQPTIGSLSDLEPAYQYFYGKRPNYPYVIDIEFQSKIGKMPKIEGRTPLFLCNRSWGLYHGHDKYFFRQPANHSDQPYRIVQISSDFTHTIAYNGEKLLKRTKDKIWMPPPISAPLERIIMMSILANHDGLLLHSAGFEVNGKGYLLAGHSGAGKTTLMRIIGQHTQLKGLSDDRIIVRHLSRKWFAYGTPWPGEGSVVSNSKIPLEAIFFIHHGATNMIKQLSRKQVMENLAQVAIIPWYDNTLLPQALSVCENLINEIPFYRFNFTPDSRAVESLKESISI